jgi:hypothetical protein
MTREIYTLKQIFIFDTRAKVKKIFSHKLQLKIGNCHTIVKLISAERVLPGGREVSERRMFNEEKLD